MDFSLVIVDILSSFWDPGSCLYVLLCEFMLTLFMAVFESICIALALVLVADLNVYNLDVIVVLRWKSNCTFTYFRCYCLQYIFHGRLDQKKAALIITVLSIQCARPNKKSLQHITSLN